MVNLRGRVGKLSSQQLNDLVTSPYADVRIFAGQCLVHASNQEVQDYGFELLIDENEVVRSTAIRAFGSRKLPGWLKVMSRSLMDENYVVQRAAIDALVADRKDGMRILRDHLVEFPESAISPLIKTELLRMGIR